MLKILSLFTYLGFLLISCSGNQKKEFTNKEGNDLSDSNLKIDTSNYYTYYSNGDDMKGQVTTAWLNAYDVTPILLEEMQKIGFTRPQKNVLYKLTTNEIILLTAYDSEFGFGFIYIDDHEMAPLKKHRNRKSIFQEYDSCEYEQTSGKPGGSLDRIEIKKMPENIYLLQQDCYWYQYSDTSSDNRSLVSKEDITNIFRQDVRKVLSTI